MLSLLTKGKRHTKIIPHRATPDPSFPPHHGPYTSPNPNSNGNANPDANLKIPPEGPQRPRRARIPSAAPVLPRLSSALALFTCPHPHTKDDSPHEFSSPALDDEQSLLPPLQRVTAYRAHAHIINTPTIHRGSSHHAEILYITPTPTSTDTNIATSRGISDFSAYALDLGDMPSWQLELPAAPSLNFGIGLARRPATRRSRGRFSAVGAELLGTAGSRGRIEEDVVGE